MNATGARAQWGHRVSGMGPEGSSVKGASPSGALPARVQRRGGGSPVCKQEWARRGRHCQAVARGPHRARVRTPTHRRYSPPRTRSRCSARNSPFPTQLHNVQTTKVRTRMSRGPASPPTALAKARTSKVAHAQGAVELVEGSLRRRGRVLQLVNSEVGGGCILLHHDPQARLRGHLQDSRDTQHHSRRGGRTRRIPRRTAIPPDKHTSRGSQGEARPRRLAPSALSCPSHLCNAIWLLRDRRGVGVVTYAGAHTGQAASNRSPTAGSGLNFTGA